MRALFVGLGFGCGIAAADGTFAVQKLESPAPTDKEPGSRHNHPIRVESNIKHSPSPRKRFLWDAGRELVDAQAALMAYAAKNHAGAVTRDDVRAIVLSVFIQMRGGAAIAGGQR